MLDIALQPLRDSGLRENATTSYPTTGYYGLSPVVVEGRVKLKTLTDDDVSIPITRILVRVRCYERCSPGNAVWPKNILWEKSVVVKEVDPTADRRWDKWSRPFRVAIPPEVRRRAPGTLRLKDYSVHWRVEAVAFHTAIAGVGDRITKSYTLGIRDYTSRLQQPSEGSTSTSTAEPASGVTCAVSATPSHIGPGDSWDGSVDLTVPKESRSSKAQFALVRRVTCKPCQSADEGRSNLEPRWSSFDSNSSSGSVFSVREKAESRDGREPQPLAPVLSETVICRTEWFDLKELAKGHYTGKQRMTLPARHQASMGSWDVGETIHEPSVDITYHLSTRISIVDGLVFRGSQFRVQGPEIKLSGISGDDSIRALADSLSHTLAVPTKRKSRSLDRERPGAIYGLGRNVDISLPPPAKTPKIRWKDQDPSTQSNGVESLEGPASPGSAASSTLAATTAASASTEGILRLKHHPLLLAR